MSPAGDAQHRLVVGTYGGAATVWHLDPASPSDSEELLRWLLPASVRGQARRPMRQVLRIAREGGCRSVVVEERYIDPDYRSEYSAFWSRRFEERRPLAKRLHFFAAPIEPETLHVAPPAGSYLGYTVLRPTDLGPVGRTVLRPPPRLGDAVLTTVRDRPSLFGNPLDVLGVPFCQQDGEFLVCAHSAAWLCHYVAHHRGVIGRRMTAEIASIPSVEGSKHRPLPATGLTGEQMQAIFSSLGIPALFYDATDLPRLPTEFPAGGFRIRGQRHRQRQRQREQLLRVVCKYINSGFPVVVLTSGRQAHAFTLVGWREEAGAIQLIACDDQVGPYEVIEDPLSRPSSRATESTGATSWCRYQRKCSSPGSPQRSARETYPRSRSSSRRTPD